MSSKLLHALIIIFFVCSLVNPAPEAHADSLLGLPEPGVMVNLSPAYEPILIKGLKVHPENPFLFDFIVDSGSDSLPLKQESSKLIKYFLTALTVPEKDLWVNLSPYEKNRMIAPNLAQTEMGRDMLAQDYILKQLTASLIYPERDLGKTFWDTVYSKAQELYGTTQVPVNTFNKVWIVADRADVYERGNVAFVVGAHLKVMLEQDYLALKKHSASPRNDVSTIGSQVVRKIILPQLESEINKGKNFASLRQMFYSMILASWYKMALKDAILTRIYGNQSKVKIGINQADPRTNQEIFSRYIRAYKKGVFNYIKEDADKIGQQSVPRKYFSGGTNFAMLAEGGVLNRINDPAKIPSGDSLSARGHLWDEAITVDPAQAVGGIPDAAMAVQRHQNELKTVVWLSKEENDQGIPEVRYTRVSTLTVGPREEEAFFRGTWENKDFVLLTRNILKMSKEGNVKIKLTDDTGITPYKYKDKEVVLSGNAAEILESFSPDELPKKLKDAPRIAVRVNEVYRVIVHDRRMDRYLYFLPFNKTALDQGKRRLNPLGGGIRFTRGGLEYYRKNVDRLIKPLPGEDPRDVRVSIQGKNLVKMLAYLNKGDHIEDNVDHELEDELNGENGLFPKGVPSEWLSHSDRAMAGDQTMNISWDELLGRYPQEADFMRMLVDQRLFDKETLITAQYMNNGGFLPFLQQFEKRDLTNVVHRLLGKSQDLRGVLNSAFIYMGNQVFIDSLAMLKNDPSLIDYLDPSTGLFDLMDWEHGRAREMPEFVLLTSLASRINASQGLGDLFQRMKVPSRSIKIFNSDAAKKAVIKQRMGYEVISSYPEGHAVTIGFSQQVINDRQPFQLALPIFPFKSILPYEDNRDGLRRSAGIGPNRKVIIFASFSQDELVHTRIFQEMFQRISLLPEDQRPLMVLAPSGISTSGAQSKLTPIKDMSDKYHLAYGERTSADVHKMGTAGAVPMGNFDIVSLDTSGELLNLYSFADLVVLNEDQNILEPVMRGAAVLYKQGLWRNNSMALRFAQLGGAVESYVPYSSEDFFSKINSMLNNAAVLRERAKGTIKAFHTDIIPGTYFVTSLALARVLEGWNARVVQKVNKNDAFNAPAVSYADQAMIGKNGGIDLNAVKMRIGIQKDGPGAVMNLDPAMIERIRTEGFDGLEFNIRSIVPVTDLPVLLGLASPSPPLHVLN